MMELWLHVFNPPKENWDTRNVAFVMDTPSFVDGLLEFQKHHTFSHTQEVYLLVAGMAIEANGYDRASLTVHLPGDPGG